jgi:tetratricopeptide (TPR) repeat protein
LSAGEEFFGKYIDKYGDQPNLLLGRARCRFKLKKYREALADANKALEQAPDFVQAEKLVRLIRAKAGKAKA